MLTASLFASYASCPRAAYLDLHGDPTRRGAPSEFMAMLLEDGRRHEAAVLDSLSAHIIRFDRRDPVAAVKKTREAMARGIPILASAPLASFDANGVLTGFGVADLLERVPGSSDLGDYLYEVVEIKKASRVKTTYRVQVAFYSDLLAGMQGASPTRGHLILGDRHRESFDLAPVRNRYQTQLARLREIEAGHEPPVYVCAQCTPCSWQGVCLPQAEREGHVSLVFGLQRELAAKLEAHGITRTDDLARQPAALVSEWTRCGESRARRIVGQARALASGGVVWRRDPRLPAAETEVFFDIEGDPERGALYLFGLLVRQGKREEYVPFLAKRPEDEARAFIDCLTFLERIPDAPIYHYHHYERTSLERLVQLHGIDPERVAALAARLRDLSYHVSDACFLPIRSYSLKSVARYLGFEWTHSKSSAVQSVVWFASWVRTGDDQFLARAIEYNEDDCRATLVLKDWLASGPHGEIEADAEVLASTNGAS